MGNYVQFLALVADLKAYGKLINYIYMAFMSRVCANGPRD